VRRLTKGAARAWGLPLKVIVPTMPTMTGNPESNAAKMERKQDRAAPVSQMNFTCLDFETANPSRVSICAAGLAVFEKGQLTEAPYWLVRPPKGYGWFHEAFIDCHGLTHRDVLDAPEFPAITPDLLAWLTQTDLVIAHNASFDMGHLRETLDHFGLPRPDFNYVCTCQLARRVWPDLPSHGLKALTAHIGHRFNHHHAQADAEAAGRVLLAMMQHANAITADELLQKTGLSPTSF
jgi:DNA polymerase-3 subunit epsilon